MKSVTLPMDHSFCFSETESSQQLSHFHFSQPPIIRYLFPFLFVISSIEAQTILVETLSPLFRFNAQLFFLNIFFFNLFILSLNDLNKRNRNDHEKLISQSYITNCSGCW